MSAENIFPLAIKSTLDALCVSIALAQSPPIQFTDLDDITTVEGVLASADSAVVWELSSLEEDPVDPLYALSFSVGARTFNDAANYDILKLVGKLKEVFKVHKSYPVYDKSGATPSLVRTGSIFITGVSVNPQAFDLTSGLRMLSVNARAQRWL